MLCPLRWVYGDGSSPLHGAARVLEIFLRLFLLLRLSGRPSLRVGALVILDVSVWRRIVAAPWRCACARDLPPPLPLTPPLGETIFAGGGTRAPGWLCMATGRRRSMALVFDSICFAPCGGFMATDRRRSMALRVCSRSSSSSSSYSSSREDRLCGWGHSCSWMAVYGDGSSPLHGVYGDGSSPLHSAACGHRALEDHRKQRPTTANSASNSAPP